MKIYLWLIDSAIHVFYLIFYFNIYYCKFSVLDRPSEHIIKQYNGQQKQRQFSGAVKTRVHNFFQWLHNITGQLCVGVMFYAIDSEFLSKISPLMFSWYVSFSITVSRYSGQSSNSPIECYHCPFGWGYWKKEENHKLPSRKSIENSWISSTFTHCIIKVMYTIMHKYS